MSALPYIPLYVADYLADTSHLSTVEHGAYLLLIMNYWQRGNGLPANDLQLSRIARLTPKEWAKVKPSLVEFFDEQDGTWTHNRVEHELEKVRDKSAKASNAGKISSQRKAIKRSTSVEHTLNHTDTDTDTDTDTESKAPLAPQGGVVVSEKGFSHGRRKQRYSNRDSFRQALEHIEAREQGGFEEGGTDDPKLLS